MKKLIFLLSFLLPLLVAVNLQAQVKRKIPIAHHKLSATVIDPILGAIDIIVFTAVDSNKIVGKPNVDSTVYTFRIVNKPDFEDYNFYVKDSTKIGLICYDYIKQTHVRPLLDECFNKHSRCMAINRQVKIILKRIENGKRVVLID